jgi:hypothetical protein
MQAMPENHLNSIVATTSGLCGGLGKALTAHLVFTNITFQGIIEVSIYAAISALVGYGVKVSIDKLRKLYNRKCQ